MKQKTLFQLLAMTILCSLLLAPTNTLARKSVDFSGDWTLNEAKSNLGEGRFMSSSAITVKQEARSIIIERTRSGRNGQTRTSSETLTLDGKENINEGENRSSVTTVSMADDGTSMTIKSDTKMSRQGQSFEMKSTETWTLNGKILTIKTTMSSQMGERYATLVYDKK
jgi:hypothetical protein